MGLLGDLLEDESEGHQMVVWASGAAEGDLDGGWGAGGAEGDPDGGAAEIRAKWARAASTEADCIVWERWV